MNKRVSYVIISALIVIAFAGIATEIWLFTSQENFANEKTIVLDEQPQTKMEVNLSGFCPGMTVSYEIHLKANKGDAFGITMIFEKTDTDSLAAFVDVEIRLSGDRIDSAKLSEYLDGKEISFPTKFEGTSEIDVEIIYSMGVEVGDEAQNTTADFDIILSAKR